MNLQTDWVTNRHRFWVKTLSDRHTLRLQTGLLEFEQSIDTPDLVLGIDGGQGPLSLLTCCATRCDYEGVVWLLDQGADINAPDADGSTALHHACEQGWIAGVELLLARGADPDVRNRHHRRPDDWSRWERRHHESTCQALQNCLDDARASRGCGLK